MSAVLTAAVEPQVEPAEAFGVSTIAGATAPGRHRTAREMIADARALLGAAGLALPVTVSGAPGLTAYADALAAAATELELALLADGTRPLRARETLARFARVQELRLEIAGHRARQALNRQRAVTAALRELRGATRLEQIFELVPQKLCGCGFSRAWMSVVEGDTWRPVSVHTTGERPRRLRQLAQLDFSLISQGSPESEALRRRRAATVTGAERDPVVAELFDARSYVLAPLLIDTRVIAFLHADRPESEVVLDDDDREVLCLFAEAVSQAIARVLLAERLERLRTDVAAATRSVEALVESRCFEPLGLPCRRADAAAEESGADEPSVRVGAGYTPAAGAARLAGLLTAREIEVLRLMAAGETNASIARELVISEGTVKSHVKSVLRKLRVANRAQAVSRYFRVVRADETI